jgi:ZIP family zinc transporter/zinc and cadmium transporter
MALTPIWLALAAATANLLGAYAVIRQRRTGLLAIDTSLAFGAGFMVAVVLVGILPTVFSDAGGLAPIYVLGGYLFVHLAQHVVAPHFHFGEETHDVSGAAAFSALLGLSLHTFFDGVAIASGFLVSSKLGVLLFLAVLLHKLPEGVAIASVSLAGGHRERQALGAAAVLGASTVVGVLMTEFVAPLRNHGLAIAAGVTLYVAASNLVPEIQTRRGWALPAAFFGGALALLVGEVFLRGLG